MTIAEFDHMDIEEKKALLRQCCGSAAWVEKMVSMPAVEDLVDLFEDAEEVWYDCSIDDWKEAFRHHPKIGDLDSLRKKFSTDRFAGDEQTGVKDASDDVLKRLAEGNAAYEKKFGFIFIVCATGKSAEDMLADLQERLRNQPKDEILNAMEEQNKITRIRLEKLFES
jgi:2-oxo-4-hydroxy-4-carboxy-5-ureidoimidazoline decarboxylase